MASSLDMGTNRVINQTDPVNAQDGATKNYVDGLANTISDINDITQADGTMIVSDGTDWVGESGATLRTSIGINALPDTEFKLADDGDATKLGAFQLSGVTPGNTRTLTWPDFDGTLATLAGTETLTNKTFDAANNTLSLTADSVDAITEIAAALKTGLDTKLVTGTAGTANHFPIWNADGDIVDDGLTFTDGDFIVGNGSAWVAEGGSTARKSMGALTSVATRTALKALDTTKDTWAALTEAGRSGIFEWRAADYSAEVTADPLEGIAIKADAIATTSGAWVRALADMSTVMPEWFGAAGDLTGDDGPAIQAAIDYLITTGQGGDILIGRHKVTTGVTLDHVTYGTETEPTNHLTSTNSRQVNFVGRGAPNSQIYYDGAGTAITYTGGAHSYLTLSRFSLQGPNRAAGTIGLSVNGCAFLYLDQMDINLFDLNLYGADILSSNISGGINRLGNKGFHFEYVSSSRPNNIAFNGHVLNGNRTYGGLIDGAGLVSWHGGSIESNALSGTEGDTSYYGLKVVNAGVEAGVGVSLTGAYIEGNYGIADIWIDQNDANYAQHTLTGTSLVRFGATKTVTITAATNANPVVLTATGHDYIEGDRAVISGVGGMTELNGNTYTLTIVDANTVSLGVDGSAYGTYTSGGSLDKNKYVTNNVKFTRTGSALSEVALFGCSFTGLGGYSESAARLYVNAPAASVRQYGNVFASATAVDETLFHIAGTEWDYVAAMDQGVATANSPTFAGLTVDTSTLVVDAANNRVGVGIATPADTFHLVGNLYLGTAATTIYKGGSGALVFQTATGGQTFATSNGSVAALLIAGSTGNVSMPRIVSTPLKGQLGIVSGVVTITGSYHTIGQEGTADDDLDTISGGVDGAMLTIRPANSTYTITAKDGTGNLALAGDHAMDNEEDTLTMIFDGGLGKWLETGRSNNGA